MSEEPIEVTYEMEDGTKTKQIVETLKDILTEPTTELEKTLLPIASVEVLNILTMLSKTNSLSVEEMKGLLKELKILQETIEDREKLIKELAHQLFRRFVDKAKAKNFDIPDIANKIGYPILEVGRQYSGDDEFNIDIFNKVTTFVKGLK